MLPDFQQALADLTASPAMCVRARQDPAFLRDAYDLTEREFGRLVGIVGQPGMQCACIVYRANRLAPLAMNAHRTCEALGPRLRAVVEEFWAAYPESNVHFYVETANFCQFLQDKIDCGADFDTGVGEAVGSDLAVVLAALELSRTEA
jgi:hypothetical protein